jgi:sortase A
MMMTRWARAVLVVVVGLTTFAEADGVGAQPTVTGPSVTIDRSEVAVGEQVRVTVAGFDALFVTISLCGNEARRGSSDCNLIASSSIEMRPAGEVTSLLFTVAAPPAACPCAIRASSSFNDEVAVVPISLIGHPIEPTVGGPNLDEPLVAATITARAAPRGLFGWIKASLGGSVPYEVTVTAKNITASETLRNVAVFASVAKSAQEEIATLALEDPGAIGPGQTWTQVVSTEVPAPSISKVQWQVIVSGAGPQVTSAITTRHRPVLLMLLLMVLVIAVWLLVVRTWLRRRARRELDRRGDGGFDGQRSDVDVSTGAEQTATELVTTST